MSKESLIINRYQGCLAGVATGDALGQPVEFLLSEDEESESITKYGEGSWIKQIRDFRRMLKEEHGGVVREMLVNPFGYWQKGEYTDDTAQTLLLVDSLVEAGQFDRNDFECRLLTWFDHGNAKGLGMTTKRALQLLDNGREREQVAEVQPDIPSNGSLMRTSPIGLYFRGYTKDLDRVAAEVSTITHSAEHAVAACQMASQLVAQLAEGLPKNEALDFVRNRCPEFWEEMMAASNQKTYPGGAFESLGISVVALGNAGSFEEAIVTAVNQGGDSDTYGAITGAFAGAYWGVAQIPDRWLKELKPESSKVICNKAQQLYERNRQLKKHVEM